MWWKSQESFDECAFFPCLAGGFTKREVSIGVRVKETRSETAMAKAEVKPKELMKRPTIPPMKPTGRNTASRESVVAITARPISLVPSTACLHRGHAFFFHEP